MTGDCDHDDHLSYDELSRYTFEFNGGGTPSVTKPQFTRADTNHDDKLNYSEFVALNINENIKNAWVYQDCQ